MSRRPRVEDSFFAINHPTGGAKRRQRTARSPCLRGSVANVRGHVYIELHTSSAFSFLRAASLPETLIDRAAMLGYPAVALIDRDGVSGAPRFHKAALAAGIRPLIGAELTIDACREPGPGNRDPETRSSGSRIPDPGSRFSLPVLVSSQEGWRNLCRLISRMKLRAPKGEGALTVDELDSRVTGLIAMPGRALLRADRF